MTSSRKSTKSEFTRVLGHLGIILLIITAGLGMIKLALRGTESTPSISFSKNSVLPDFTLQRMDGTTLPISSLKDKKVFLINFWASWCSSCMEEMPSLVKVREEFKDQGFEILGINLDEHPEAMIAKVAKEYKIGFPVFKDPEGTTADLFDVHGIPLSIIINSQRKVLHIQDGGKEWDTPEFTTQLKGWLTE